MITKIFCSFLTLIIFALPLVSQNTELSKKEKKEILKRAEEYYIQNHYHTAADLFKQLYNADPDDPYYKMMLAINYTYIQNKAKESLQLLTEIKNNNPEYNLVNLHLGRAYAINHQFKKAKEYFQLYIKDDKLPEEEIEKGKLYLSNCENAIVLIKDSLEVEITNLGYPVNTVYEEYVPIISPDESILIFTYRGIKSKGGKLDPKGRPDPNGEYSEDVMISYKYEDQWSEPESIGKNINTNEQDASVALSISGEKLFIYKSSQKKGAGDIYISELEDGVWSVPQFLEGEINSPYWEGSLTMTADENIIYFASERPDGFGGRDLWKVEKMSDGSWGNIKNLGNTINTKYDDDAPFIHPDGKTMYFSSKGHNSMGGYDIFYTHLDGTTWDPPGNVGYPINTFFDDRYYVLTADGEEGYFSSAGKYSVGGYDILKVKPGHFGTKPIVALIANVENMEESPTIVNTNDTSKEKDKAKYTLSITPGNKYKIAIEVEGDTASIQYLNVASYETYLKENEEEDAEKIESSTEVPANKSQGSSNIYLSEKEKLSTERMKIKGLGFKLEIASSTDSAMDFSYLEKYRKVHQKTYASGLTHYSFENFSTLEEVEDFKRMLYLEEPDIASKLITVFVLESEEEAPMPNTVEVASAEAIAQSNCVAVGLDKYASFLLKKLPDEQNYKRMYDFVGDFCSEGLTFEVQIAAYRKPKNYKYDFLEGLGKVKIRDYPDEITRFTQGSFLTFAEAEVMRQKIIAKGQKDAWITPFFQGSRFTMKELISGEFGELLQEFPTNRIPYRSQVLWF